jgi:hypothetical protein
MLKYEPLQTYLAGLSAETQDMTMAFAQIEKILNAELPPSAHKYRPWWANEYRYVRAVLALWRPGRKPVHPKSAQAFAWPGQTPTPPFCTQNTPGRTGWNATNRSTP